MHNSYINVLGNKDNNGNWNLEITVFDVYDFTELQEIEKYIDDNDLIIDILASTGNNLAMLGTSCNVVNEYKITIKFKIENWEV